MLRKFALVILAVSTLSVASLSPTPASAWRGGWHGGWGWGGGWGWRGGWAPGWQVGWGPAWGVLDGDLLGDLGGDGADHVSSRRQDFTETGVLSGVLSADRGGRVGFSSIGAGGNYQT